MNTGVSHILAPEELTQRLAGSPKHHLVIVDSVELQRLQNALVRVAAVHITLADNGAKLVSRVDRTLVHIYLNTVPVAVMDELGKINLAHHRRHYMAVLQVEIIIRTIEVGWHYCDIVGSILKVVALAHLQSGNLSDGIFLVGIFQRRSKEHILTHWLRSILWIDAGRAQEEELLHTMRISIADHVALHLHVLHDEVGTIERICHDSAHEGSSQNHCIRLLLVKELLYCILVGQVEFFVRTTHLVMIASLLEIIPDSRPHKSVVSCYINL